MEPVSFDFTKMSPGDALKGLTWFNPPESAAIEAGKGLKVVPKPKTDFWRKTYLNPPADRTSGHALLYKLPSNTDSWIAEISFSLNPVVQFDQAGAMVFIDKEHWLKAGIEFENGDPNMSCVVTNGFSDWGYKTWPSSQGIEIRIEYQRYGDNVCEFLVQYKEKNGEWTFLREAPMTLGNGGAEGVSVGVMCCSPKGEPGKVGMDVVFQKLNIFQK